MSALTGIEGPLVTPGSPEWLSTISASKVPVILSLSPFDSRFSLWHRIKGSIPTEADNDEFRRGQLLEPAVAQWWASVNEDCLVVPTGTWSHPERPWQTASPDRLVAAGARVRSDLNAHRTVELLECKTSTQDHEWGDQGTDQIPPYVRAQVIWQMDTTGARRCHVAVLTSFLEFRAYVVDYDPAEAEFIRGECAEFLRTIHAGERPDIDEHTATYAAIRELHPSIDGTDYDAGNDEATEYLESRAALAAAKDRNQLATSVLFDHMGDAKRARWDGYTIANRQVRRDGPPFLVAGRNLPDLTQTTEPQGTAA